MILCGLLLPVWYRGQQHVSPLCAGGKRFWIDHVAGDYVELTLWWVSC